MWKAGAIIESHVWFWECLLHISSFMKYIAWLFLTSVLPLPDDLRHVFRFFFYFILYRQLSVVKTTLSLQLYFDSNTGLVLRWNLSSFWEELRDMRLHSLQERERDYRLWNPMLYHPEKKTNGCSHFLTIQRCVYYSKYFSLRKGDQLWFVVFFCYKGRQELTIKSSASFVFLLTEHHKHSSTRKL